MLKRLILWIIRAIAIIVFVLALVVAIMDPEHRIIAIIVTVAAFFIAGSTAKAKEKSKSNDVSKCKKCGHSLSNAYYKYSYNSGKAYKSPYNGLWNIPIDINITCPHCGKVKYLPENVESATLNDENVKDLIKQKMQNYLG